MQKYDLIYCDGPRIDNKLNKLKKYNFFSKPFCSDLLDLYYNGLLQDCTVLIDQRYLTYLNIKRITLTNILKKKYFYLSRMFYLKY